VSAPENPPAFPMPETQWHLKQNGMTLRDWFAGQALSGFCSMADGTGMWTWPHRDAAAQAYELADAMLAARAGGAA